MFSSIIIYFLLFGTALCSSSCRIDIRKPRELQPLMLTTSYKSPTFDVSDAGQMFIPGNKEFLLICPEKFKNFPDSGTVTATCAGGSKFLINGNKYEFSDLECTEAFKHVINKSGEECLPTGRSEFYKIQFNLPDDKVFEVYQICMEKGNNDPTYTKLTMHHSFADFDYTTEWLDNDQFSLDFTTAYGDCKSQNEYISDRIGKPFHKDEDCCFDLLQLMSYRNLFPGVSQRAAFSYVNTAAFWSTCHGENWKELEKRVRSLAKSTPNDILVWTGVKFDNDNNEIAFGNQYNHPPIYLWKVIQDPGTKSSLAVVEVNVPDLNATEASSKYKVCNDICDQSEWMQNGEWDDPSRGYTYCCSIQEFKSYFNIDSFEKGYDKVLIGSCPEMSDGLGSTLSNTANIAGGLNLGLVLSNQ